MYSIIGFADEGVSKTSNSTLNSYLNSTSTQPQFDQSWGTSWGPMFERNLFSLYFDPNLHVNFASLMCHVALHVSTSININFNFNLDHVHHPTTTTIMIALAAQHRQRQQWQLGLKTQMHPEPLVCLFCLFSYVTNNYLQMDSLACVWNVNSQYHYNTRDDEPCWNMGVNFINWVRNWNRIESIVFQPNSNVLVTEHIILLNILCPTISKIQCWFYLHNVSLFLLEVKIKQYNLSCFHKW